MCKDKCISCNFLTDNLYQEKLFHKKTRHEYVKQKIIFIFGLLSIGKSKIPGIQGNENIFLIYLVPLISIIYDLFIYSEDYKIKRIGAFLRDISGTNCDKEWEKRLAADSSGRGNRRDVLAERASFILSIIATVISFLFVIHYFYATGGVVIARGLSVTTSLVASLSFIVSLCWFPFLLFIDTCLFLYAKKKYSNEIKFNKLTAFSEL